MRTQGARLLQQLIYQRGLAMVDVRNDGYVSEVFNHVAVSSGGARTLPVFVREINDGTGQFREQKILFSLRISQTRAL